MKDLTNTYEWLVWTINWRDKFKETLEEINDLRDDTLSSHLIKSCQVQIDDLNKQIEDYGKK